MWIQKNARALILSKLILAECLLLNIAVLLQQASIDIYVEK